ncbi:MAG: DNA helicase RecQ [Gammaproteobacteria bacterium]
MTRYNAQAMSPSDTAFLFNASAAQQNNLAAARHVLQRVFGHNDFVGRQAEVIAETLDGRDALAIMPTGGGKSLCYQIPAILRPGVGVVVSPLIALMKDQVDALSQHGVRAACLNSAISIKQARDTQARFLSGDLDLLYVAPERLLSDSCLAMLQQSRIALFAIDEAHCVSQWGHDFRRDYLQLGQLADIFPQVPRLALTATADLRTRREIIDNLRLQQAAEIIASFDRPNIRYHIRPKENSRQQFLDFYHESYPGESGIIYCLTRKRTEEIAEWLEKQNLSAFPYHAGMNKATRERHQENFVRGDGIIMVATVAFGMGIDKPDVRFVAHFDMPKSVEGYYQETGRAGRDGLPSQALLFYGLADAIRIRQLVDESGAPEHIKRLERQKVDNFLGLCESARCRRELLLASFGETYHGPCGNCDNCLNPPQEWDGTVAAQKFLSGVIRAGERFGTAHIVDILLGKHTPKIEKFAHDRLSTFGIGSELSISEWHAVARQLIAAGHLCADSERFGALKLSPSARPLLRGDEKISFRRAPPKAPSKKTTRPTRTTAAPPTLNDEQTVIFNALRTERRRLAAAQNVPAYVIFHDSTLLEMARQTPQTIEEFATLPGVGAAKVERYGSTFIKIIKTCLLNDSSVTA